jgi:23S rRNA (cytidine2498-2'-O)-methyltransferase
VRAFICTPGFEEALKSELGPASIVDAGGPLGVVLAEGNPSSGEAAWPADPVFARQILPGARRIQGASVSQMAEGLYQAVQGVIDAWDGPFVLHTLPAARGIEPALCSRAALMGQELIALLRARRRRASRRHQPPPVDTSVFGERSLLIQVLALDRTTTLVSAAVPRALAMGGYDLAPWPAGIAPVAEDRTPPSRAYLKLEEAFCWMGDQPRPEDRCIDLGAAPGGWTFTALRRGARVTAVDRAPLDPPARGHPRLQGVVGNAFNFAPPDPVDWLLCDVICEPARTVALIDTWASRGWCRKLVATVKFKGSAGYGALGEIGPLLRRAGWRFGRVKHLHHNKNEVTVMAIAAGKDTSPRSVINTPATSKNGALS